MGGPAPTTLKRGGPKLDEIRRARPGVTATVLYHLDPSRVGDMCALPLGKGASHDISRVEPLFASGASLDDPYLSRSPLILADAGYGAITLTPATDRVLYTVDGNAGDGATKVEPAQLDAGVVVSVGERILLLLERGLRDPCAVEALGMLGVSRGTERLRATITKLAPQAQPVLLYGQSGTGKELAARALHEVSDRRDGPFITANLAAVVGSTAASQLFGHTKGAFTGADSNAGGFFGQAEGGTLFLDEIGEASLALQALLLRVLESGEVQPVGGTARVADVRVVTATNADLEGMVESGEFRVALYHRLVNAAVHLEPLRDRRADVGVQLVRSLDELASQQMHPEATEDAPWLSIELMETLLGLDWPGNTRQLIAFARHLATEYGDAAAAALDDRWRGMLTERAPPAESGVATQVDSRREESATNDGPSDVRAVLAAHGYRIEPAAKALGMAKNTLYAELHRAGIPVAKDLTAEQIAAARAAVGDDVAAIAAKLEVSLSGLRRRIKALGV